MQSKNRETIKIQKPSYGSRIKRAYEQGYSAGWADGNGNKAFGSSVSGAIGYGNGNRARQRYEKAKRSERYVKNIRLKTKQ